MSVSGVIDGVDRVSLPSDGRPAWRVLVTPDTPTPLAGGDGKPLRSFAFHIARAADPDFAGGQWAVAPIGAGDRVTLQLLHGARDVPVLRPDGVAITIRMLGWASDPDAPLT